jgi:hypothetical protein
MEFYVANSITDFQLVLRMKSVIWVNPLPSQNSKPLLRLSMPVTGNVRVKFLEKPNPHHSNPPKPSTSDHASSHPSRSRNHRSRQNKSAKPTSASTSSTPKAPDLNTKLGKDGKLMAKEHQRCFDKKLCLFCGGPGHSAWDCTKSTSHTAKGHAATVTPETKQEASSEAKK